MQITNLELNANQLLEKLTDTCKQVFKDESRILITVDYLNKLFLQCDESKIDKLKFNEFILKCQKSVENENTIEGFQELITFLLPFKKVVVVSNKKKTTFLINSSSDSKIDLLVSNNNQPKCSHDDDDDDDDSNNNNSTSCSSRSNHDDNEQEEEEDEKKETIEKMPPLTQDELRALDHIKKLDECCQKLNKQIIETEKSEIDLNDENSKYVKDEEILKKRFNKAYNQLVIKMRKYPHLVEVNSMPKIYKKSSNKSFKKLEKFDVTRYPEINIKIMEKLNKLKIFPDYVEVVEWITEANNESQLSLSQEKIQQLAKDSFEEIGRHLKKSRNQDDARILNSRILSIEPEALENEKNVFEIPDPALKDEKIDKILNENKRKADEKSNKIMEEYSQKQAENLDHEDDEDDSEDDEDDDEHSSNSSASILDEDKVHEIDEINENDSFNNNNNNNNNNEEATQPKLIKEESGIDKLVKSVLKTDSKNNNNNNKKRDSSEFKESNQENKKLKQCNNTAVAALALSSKTIISPKIISCGSLKTNNNKIKTSKLSSSLTEAAMDDEIIID